MNNKILVINGGSSSIKYQLIDSRDLNVISSGICERIFVDGNFVNKTNGKKVEIKTKMSDHTQAFEFMINFFIKHKIIKSLDEIKGIGHRIVHGGTNIKESKVIDSKIKKEISNCIRFAPLHNEPELVVIEAASKFFKKAKHVAVFDTSFHSTIPDVNRLYAVPNEWIEKYGVRRYGMHGTSYQYITLKMQEILKKKKPNLIVCHLGNGASISAIKEAKSFNTSMGLTPLEGLVMGTRSGDIDPSIINYICEQTKKSVSDVTNDLNKKSGMLGLTGNSDFRDITSNLKNKKNKLGFDIYVKRVVDYIVRYANDLENNIDALVFTAGVGENDEIVRQEIINKIKVLPISLDKKKNMQKYDDYKLISDKKSKIKVYAIRTNEEKMIAKEVKRLAKL